MRFKLFLTTVMAGTISLSSAGQEDNESLKKYKRENELRERPTQTAYKASETLPLKDFFRNPEKRSFKYNLEGSKLAFLAPLDGRMNIFIAAPNGDEAKPITAVTDRDIADFFWVSNQILVYSKDNGGDENYVMYSVLSDGTKLMPLTPESGVRANLVNVIKGDSINILVETNERDLSLFDVYKIDATTGDKKMVAFNPGGLSNWVNNSQGDIMVALKTDGVNSSLVKRARLNSNEWEELVKTNFRESITPFFMNTKGTVVYCVSNIGRDKAAAVAFDLNSKSADEVIFEHPEVDIEAVYSMHKTNELLGVSYVLDKREFHYIADEFSSAFNNLVARVPNYSIEVVSTTEDDMKWVVRTYSDKSLGSYLIYDRSTDELRKLCDLSPWLKEGMMRSMENFAITTSDGTALHGYITYPRSPDQQNLPLVVIPHGGPWARDSWGFNPEVQFLANRGYAVLQVNFRGSTGYGRAFWEKGFKQWGLKMQSDLTESVQYLIDRGVVDPNRVAIYGASYGGYAALAGLAFTPDLYACGVDYVGVSNLFTFMKTIPPYWEPYLEMMYEMVGNPKLDTELFNQCSPVFHVDKIKAPLFIAQGAKDPRVNINESNQMVEAMRKNGREVEYMVKPDEGHGFANEENRIEFYQFMEKFLERHMR
jgi:dipeptidyl aminopeptidase/acylaminoacyl peptidase